MELAFIVVDDTPLDHFIARSMIANKSTSLQVEGFLSGALALEHIKTQQPDKNITVVLVDIYMPIMDGFQFVEEFEKLPAYIQQYYYIVALTSSISTTDFNQISAFSSLKGYISKPITAEELDGVINNVVATYNIKLPQ